MRHYREIHYRVGSMINNSEISGFSFHFNAFKVKESIDAKIFLLIMAILLSTVMSPSISADIGSMENCLLEVIKGAKMIKQSVPFEKNVLIVSVKTV